MEYILLGVALLVIATIVVVMLKIRSGKAASPNTGIAKEKVQTIKKSSDADRLLGLDLGTDTVASIQSRLSEDTTLSLDDVLVQMLTPKDSSRSLVDDATSKSEGPKAIIFVGVNGVGKTTSLGKIAYLIAKTGKKCVLGAADTFRAAAGDQLEIWGERANKGTKGHVEVVRGQAEGVDPASVAFEAARKAVEIEADFLLVDTAGRQQTNKNLMQELAKIKRSVEKNTSVDEILLVLDATTGQTALMQAQEFHDAVDISGIILTKLDGSAKGGVIFRVVQELGVPVRFIGTGEGVQDISEFDAKKFVESL
jgi:fused signal recognition particle receptor